MSSLIIEPDCGRIVFCVCVYLKILFIVIYIYIIYWPMDMYVWRGAKYYQYVLQLESILTLRLFMM